MIDLQVDDSDLYRQLRQLEQFEPTLQREFGYAGERTGHDLKRDLKRGVAQITGGLAEGITGAVRPQGGIEVDLVMGSTARNAGYDYGARLDKDGRMRWQSGKFAGSRTWGWWSYAGPRVAQRFFKRNYQLALDTAVRKLLGKQ